MFAIGMGAMMSSMNSSIINVCLPTLVKQLNTDFATIQWVILSFLLVVTGLMLSTGRLGDMVGKKIVYMVGLVIFTLASFLCGFSPSVEWLIGFRVLQGLGGVMMQALAAAIITEAFPPAERGTALGVIGAVISIGIALGPGIGGIMIGLAGWRTVFWVNVPLGLITLIAVYKNVPYSSPTQSGQKFDVIGSLILLLTLTSYSLAMTMGQNMGFRHNLIICLLAGAGTGLLLFVLVESKIKHPMMNLGMFRHAMFSLNLFTGLLVFVSLGGLFIIPFYLELVKGYSPFEMGLLMMAVPIMMAGVAMKAGRVSDKYGSKGISLIGLLFIGGGCLTTSTLDVDTGVVGYLLRLAPLGVGFGLFQAPNSSAIMGSAPREHLGVASGLMALSRNLGNATGIPLFGAVFSIIVFSGIGPGALDSIVSLAPEELVKGIRGAYQLAAVMTIIPFVLSTLAWLDGRRRKV